MSLANKLKWFALVFIPQRGSFTSASLCSDFFETTIKMWIPPGAFSLEWPKRDLPTFSQVIHSEKSRKRNEKFVFFLNVSFCSSLGKKCSKHKHWVERNSECVKKERKLNRSVSFFKHDKCAFEVNNLLLERNTLVMMQALRVRSRGRATNANDVRWIAQSQFDIK